MQQDKIILKLLRPGNQKMRMYGSWIALCIGLLLLFIAALAWFDFRSILSNKGKEDSMASYLVIGKKVTNESMMRNPEDNLFTQADIEGLQHLKNVNEVGSLNSNNYPVSASMGGHLGFYTEMFLGSADDKYLDVLPEDWSWQSGQQSLPIIMSTDFLNLYNYGFALSQGLPQLSQQSIKALPLEISIARGKEKYRAQIVGFTDRISSVLVPQNFMDEMNKKYGVTATHKPSRLILKVQDPSEKTFVSYLKTKDYTTNEEQLRWNKIRTIVQAIVTSVGAIAVIVVGMALLSFILFIEITVQKAAGHIRLMKQIGYAPGKLRKILNRFFLPWVSSAVIVAAIIAFGIHVFMVQWLKTLELHLNISDAWIIVVLVLALLSLLFLLLRKSVKNILQKV
ncbi:hypothetical protein F0919_05705 [Taibaiella lutea]|uniref:FtsX-like permease family protein n=1 Tax=Taibaiella lutea TaxID=2608001 RepID=A0A5M6CPZ3_9BACT|nr:hypothetical protein [Taibaiella lutea]KAA5537167.1 hypothetical protein F0919_05705 [Taibaiella lutea]